MREGFVPFVLAGTHIVMEPGGHVSPEDLPHASPNNFVFQDSIIRTQAGARYDGPAYSLDNQTPNLPRFMMIGSAPRNNNPLWKPVPAPGHIWVGQILTRLQVCTLTEQNVVHPVKGGVSRSEPAGLRRLMDALNKRLVREARRERCTISMTLTWTSVTAHEIHLSIGIGNRPLIPNAQRFWENLRSILS